MSTRVSLLLFTFFLAYAKANIAVMEHSPHIEEVEYPKNFSTLATLKEFVEIVNKHDMNVSVIVSFGENYNNGNLKEVVAMTLTFPVNSEMLTKSKVKDDEFDKIAKIANEEKITIASSQSTKKSMTVMANNKRGVPINRAYKIFTGIKNGKIGFVFDEKDFAAQYTFITHGSDGKNQTTRILYGDVDVEVVDKSANLKDDELNMIKKAVVDGFFTNEDDVVANYIVTLVSNLLPNHKWDVAVNAKEESYIDSNNWAHLKILGEGFLVYSI
ncbi:hypothetical protein MTP99_017887 [Tenebrio molitor]|nr:hypothetical protein MTP99_017887 [Tenebrio molitor]